MGDLQLVAWHGWGFSAESWEPWMPLLPEGTRFQAFDRGYFGAPAEPLREGSLPLALVCHSFGLHLVPDAWLMQTDLLVVCGGFRSFHPDEPEAQRRSEKVLKRMIRRFEQEPDAVLSNFHRNCWHPIPPPGGGATGDLNGELLARDLVRLGREEWTPDALRKGARICILHGGADRIVSPESGRILAGLRPEDTRFHAIADAPHALPYSHAERCLALLKPEFEELVKRNGI